MECFEKAVFFILNRGTLSTSCIFIRHGNRPMDLYRAYFVFHVWGVRHTSSRRRGGGGEDREIKRGRFCWIKNGGSVFSRFGSCPFFCFSKFQRPKTPPFYTPLICCNGNCEQLWTCLGDDWWVLDTLCVDTRHALHGDDWTLSCKPITHLFRPRFCL